MAVPTFLGPGEALAQNPPQGAEPNGEKPPADPAKPASYWRDVRPILVEHCQGCHQPAKAGGKIVLTAYADLGEGGLSKKAVIVPGKPGESLILEEITPHGAELPEMPKDQPPLHALQVELIRRWIAEGARDDTPESARVMVSAESPPIYSIPPVLTSIDYSPDGSLLAVSGYHEVLLYQGDGSGIVARLVGVSERIESVVFSPDGKLLAVTGGTPSTMGELQLWDVEKRKLRLSVPVTHDTVYGVSWSPDGRLVAFGCSDNTIRAVEVETGKQVLYNGAHSDWVLDTVFSTDGSHLISVSRDRSMKLIQVPTQQFIDNITSITPGALAGGLISVDRHPTKDELLVGGADGIPKIYKTYRTQARRIGDDFNLLRKLEPLRGRIFSVEYSSDGARVVVGSSDEGTGEVRVYQAEDGKLVSKAKSPCAVYAVTFRGDGKAVAAAGFDGIVRILNPDDGSLVKEIVAVPLALLERAL